MTISTLPPAPLRSDAANADTYTETMETFVAALPIFSTQVNNTLTNVNAAAIAALASSNFKGSWAALTGAMSIPASVLHTGTLWLLVINTSDITADEPGVSAKWLNLASVSGYVSLVGDQTIAGNKTFTDTVTAGAFVGDGSGLTDIGLGTGQTWQDFSSSGRTLGTVYTNSTGRPISLMVTFQQIEATWSYGYISIDAFVHFYRGGVDIAGQSGVSNVHGTSVIVPAGSTYKVAVSDPNTMLYRWYELR